MGNMNQVLRRKTCRNCGGSDLQKVISLGSTPPANAFLKKEDLDKPEASFPLELYFCIDCAFCQLVDVVDPDVLYRNYVYVSSTSPSFIAHFQNLAKSVIARLNMAKNSLVVDIGSNDGILLRPFKEQGMKVVGVDPATKIAELATKNGIPTIPSYFDVEVARKIASQHGYAKLATATSVFTHVDDLDGLIKGVKEVLADDGVFVIESYYLGDLVEKNLFDTIYHEHLSYFCARTFIDLFRRRGMQVFHIEKNDTHGGSLRVFVQKDTGKRQLEPSVAQFLLDESRLNLDRSSTFIEYAKKIEANKQKLLEIIKDLKSKGKRIVGYGAAAKSNTLMNYFGITPAMLDYIVDDSPWKQGLYTPGTRIPVVGPDMLQKQPPDYTLLLAWNYACNIMDKYMSLGKFIVPVPKPVVINDSIDQDMYRIAYSLGSKVHDFSGRTLLITGGSGFLGSYMVAALEFLNKNVLDQPCKVISIDNFLIARKKNLVREIDDPNVNFKMHDVCVPLRMYEPVDYIISAAGIASPVYYKHYPLETIEGTTTGVKNMLELARERRAKSILYFSSSEIYGDPDPKQVPTPETYRGHVSSTGPRACYDESKRLGETICVTYHQLYNLPVKIVRPFNVYGPGMSPMDHRVVPNFITKGFKGEHLHVYGGGGQTRTFCYVTDAVIGFFKILLSNRDGEVYNVGNDLGEINMNDLAKMVVENVFDNKVQAKLEAYPNQYPTDEPQRRCPDLTKIRTHLGYAPAVDIKVGLKRTALWLGDYIKNNK